MLDCESLHFSGVYLFDHACRMLHAVPLEPWQANNLDKSGNSGQVHTR
jgi:hypothetical protein